MVLNGYGIMGNESNGNLSLSHKTEGRCQQDPTGYSRIDLHPE